MADQQYRGTQPTLFLQCGKSGGERGRIKAGESAGEIFSPASKPTSSVVSTVGKTAHF